MHLPRLLLHVILLCAIPLLAADWPQWLGTERNSTTPETGWNTDWNAHPPKVTWRAKVGVGVSSVTVVGDRLFTQGHRDGSNLVQCLDPNTGILRWSFAYPGELHQRQFEGGTASTPTFHDNRLYLTGIEGEVFCLDARTGRELWSLDMVRDLQGRLAKWMYAGSPLIVGERVIVEPGAENGAVAALDHKTGRVLWKSLSAEPGYASPITYPGGIAVHNQAGLFGLDPETGRELFHFPRTTMFGVQAMTPVYAQGLFFLSSAYGKGGVAVSVTNGEASVVYEVDDLNLQFQNAAYHKGYLYGVDGWNFRKANLRCVDFKTGEVKWSLPFPGKRGNVIVAGDHLLVLTEVGELLLLRAQPTEPKLLGRLQVLGGTCWAVPVLAHGRIFCRSNQGILASLDVSAPSAPSPPASP